MICILLYYHKIVCNHGIETSHPFGIEWGFNGDTGAIDL